MTIPCSVCGEPATLAAALSIEKLGRIQGRIISIAAYCSVECAGESNEAVRVTVIPFSEIPKVKKRYLSCWCHKLGTIAGFCPRHGAIESERRTA